MKIITGFPAAKSKHKPTPKKPPQKVQVQNHQPAPKTDAKPIPKPTPVDTDVNNDHNPLISDDTYPGFTAEHEPPYNLDHSEPDFYKFHYPNLTVDHNHPAYNYDHGDPQFIRDHDPGISINDEHLNRFVKGANALPTQTIADIQSEKKNPQKADDSFHSETNPSYSSTLEATNDDDEKSGRINGTDNPFNASINTEINEATYAPAINIPKT